MNGSPGSTSSSPSTSYVYVARLSSQPTTSFIRCSKRPFTLLAVQVAVSVFPPPVTVAFPGFAAPSGKAPWLEVSQ